MNSTPAASNAEIDLDSLIQQTPFLAREKDVKSKVLPKSCEESGSRVATPIRSRVAPSFDLMGCRRLTAAAGDFR